MASKQQQGFRMCVHPCPRYLTGGDTHILCVACLGEEQHGQCSRALTVSTAMCFPCGRSDSAWRSFTRTERSPGLWSRCCRGTAKAAVLGFAKGSVCGGRDGRCLFSAFKSNQIKSLLLSHHHSTSALVSEILTSVLQTVQKNKTTIYIWTVHIYRLYRKTMCKIHIHILSRHSVL